jgi:hypothetical protein
MEIKKFKLFKQKNNLQTTEQPEQSEQKTDNQDKNQYIEQQKPKNNTNISAFFSKLFEARQMAHVYHLQVKGDMGSYAAHIALSDFYDDLLDFIDKLIEVYQGQYGLIEQYTPIDTKEATSKDKVQYFEELANFVKTERKCIDVEDSHLLNIVDEILSLIYILLYKLKFNK